MPVFGERKIIDVTLPSFGKEDPAIVKIYDRVISSDLEGVDTSDKVNSAFQVYANTIVSWNLTDKDGKTIPVTAENIKKLPIDDIDELANRTHIKNQLDNLKKNN